jgi:hypothetical protein
LVSGLGEENHSVKVKHTIITPNKKFMDDYQTVLEEVKSGKEGMINQILPQAGQYHVCFYSTDKYIYKYEFIYNHYIYVNK